MGSSGSKKNAGGGGGGGSAGASEAKRKHLLLDSAAYAQVARRHGEIAKLKATQAASGAGTATASEANAKGETAAAAPPPAPESSAAADAPATPAAPAAAKESANEAVTGRKVTEALGLPAEDATAVARIFRQSDQAGPISLEIFVDVVANLVKGTTSDMRRAIFAGATGPGKSEATPELLGELLSALYHAAGNESGSFKSAALIAGFEVFADKQSKLDGSEEVRRNFGMFNRWCSAQVPSLQEGLHGLVGAKMLGMAAQGSATAGKISAGTQAAVAKSEVMSPADVFALSCADSRAASSWDLLFSSNQHGMSFDMLFNSILGYAGPTLIAIMDAEGNVFGGLVSETWSEAAQFYGNTSSTLVSLRPKFQTLSARTDGSSPGTNHFQFLRCRGKSGILGLGFGGDENSPRLWLDRNFEGCRAADFDLTYEQGDLRPRNADGTSTFKPFIIEAWGFGGSEAASAQATEVAAVDKMRMDRRKVDRKKFAENSFDREFLLGKTYGHQQQIENRGGR
ncbi:TLD domain-containing protein 1 [Hondaea fermentalgiana]|uniref:TLD domain-containing protein 1 n=1 Tax=Hondaea fermentalgiana TaxID=2315210 RepID=A0A2R5G1T6_9STRA|nr:TLD domain-containing protein 1 [Hondaea fermentalgiana]|eukprot:GBG24970.1 TLD domain-containing protein 1 [Hondaea fermentalgiana]